MDKAFVSASIDNKDYYVSTYTRCDGPELYYTSGQITVEEVKNGYVSGVAKGMLRQRTATSEKPYCFGEEISFLARFKYKKK